MHQFKLQVLIQPVLPIFLLLTFECLEAFELTVLHTNDLHSRFDEVTASGGKCRLEKDDQCFGGVARIKYVVDQRKKSHPNNVFLNAGDFFQVSYIIKYFGFFFWKIYFGK
jgi:2',3'-cyclic-nucleotide 2'-phosphodiesterase (5'-nucleotidase family)